MGLSLLLVCVLASGCFSLGSYRTAKPVEPGIVEVGVAYTATRISPGTTTATVEDPVTGVEQTEETEDGITVFLPNGLAELYFAAGLVPDLEMIGRVALHSGLLELGVNYRFIGDDSSDVHLSVAPALGVRFGIIFEGISAKLPVLFTYDINETINMTFGGIMDYNYITLTDGFGDDESGPASFAGTFLTAGVTWQMRFEGRTGYFGPILEYSHLVADLESDSASSSSGMNLFFVGITAGWYLGREDEKLERIEERMGQDSEKLDRIERKLDTAPTPATPVVEPPDDATSEPAG
jgi:hypothetical protein